MKKVAVVGLGIMGHGIADNFLKNGFEVFVWNRTADRATDLVKRGAKLVDSPEEAALLSDIVFEVTANDESSSEVWLGDMGILKGASIDKVLVTCATLSVDWIKRLNKECQKQKFSFLDMPMTGSRVGAESGQLVLFVGGKEEDLSKIRHDLKAIAKDVKYFGPVGSGTKFKLILNTLQAIHMIGFGEALHMAKAVGLDEHKTAEALTERPGGVITKIAADSYFEDSDKVTFSVEWITKDLGYAAEMVKDIDHKLLSDVLAKYKKVMDSGKGPEDWTKATKL